MSNRSQLILYSMRISRIKNRIHCSFCDLSLLPKEYEKHCSEFHNLDSRLCCVWCGGAVSWSPRRKNRHVDHLVACYRKFIAPRPPSELLPAPSFYDPFNTNLMCEAKRFFDHPRLQDLPERAYEDAWLLPLNPQSLPFQDDSLSLAAACVQKYVELEDSTDWFHVMVRAVAIPSFLEALDEEEGRMRTLPFSCFCNGGKQHEARFRQHKHLVLVSSPKNRFRQENWIRKVKPLERPSGRGKFHCVKSKAVISRLHLIHLLGYLSRRRSSCNFSYDQAVTQSLNHFWIARPLCVDYRRALAVQFDGGLSDLIHNEFSLTHLKTLMQVPMQLVNSRYKIRVADLPGVRLNMVLPVSFEFIPCQEETIHFLHLSGGKKLFFRVSVTDPDNWMELQARGGNQFYRIVGNDYFVPGPNRQIFLKCTKPLMERNAELETKLESLERENMDLRSRLKEVEQDLQEIREDHRQEINELRMKMERMSEDHRQEIRELHMKIERMSDKEIARLEAENAALKERLAKCQCSLENGSH